MVGFQPTYLIGQTGDGLNVAAVNKRTRNEGGVDSMRILPQYPLLETPEGTAFRQVVDYIQNLQENDCVARPQNWVEIIY
jgi:hypothetical protein